MRGPATCFVVFLVLWSSLSLLSPGVGQAATIHNLTFNSLPSSQGFVYAGTPENQIFSVNGTMLTLNSQALDNSAWGNYLLGGGYDPALDTVLDVTMKVYAGTTNAANVFQFRSGSVLFDFAFSDSGAQIYGGGEFVAMATTDSFHDYRMVLPGGLGTYKLFQDGALKASGSALSGSFGPGQFSFGESDISGSGRVDFTRITLTSGAVPEPVTAFLCLGGLLLLVFRRRFSVPTREQSERS